MKYKLGKGLPFAKAGAEVYMAVGYNYICVKDHNGYEWYLGFQKELEKFIEDGWIEEVKPREFWISKMITRDKIYGVFNTEFEANKAEPLSEIIKVMEVL